MRTPRTRDPIGGPRTPAKRKARQRASCARRLRGRHGDSGVRPRGVGRRPRSLAIGPAIGGDQGCGCFAKEIVWLRGSTTEAVTSCSSCFRRPNSCHVVSQTRRDARRDCLHYVGLLFTLPRPSPIQPSRSLAISDTYAGICARGCAGLHRCTVRRGAVGCRGCNVAVVEGWQARHRGASRERLRGRGSSVAPRRYSG